MLIDESLKSLEQEFPDRFLRIHRNALVATRQLVGLEKGADGAASPCSPAARNACR
jgi:two-component system response regulator AlgR